MFFDTGDGILINEDQIASVDLSDDYKTRIMLAAPIVVRCNETNSLVELKTIVLYGEPSRDFRVMLRLLVHTPFGKDRVGLGEKYKPMYTDKMEPVE